MTENEAIIKHIEENNNRIENIKFFMSSNRDANIDDCKRNIEILEISNKALEKQIPKKPKCIDKETETFDCPCCGHTIIALDDMTIHNNCLMCGQKLDWSDTD